MGPKLRIGLLVIIMQVATYASSQELYKRSPQGFLGMRGKKYMENDLEHFFKRRPQFFVGVKGKKSLFSQPELPDGIYKRAPMGFVGMRGKKEFKQFSDSGGYDLPPYGSLIGQIDYATNGFDDSKPIPFLKYLVTEYLHRLANPEENDNTYNLGFENRTLTDSDSNEIEKRSVNMRQYYEDRDKKSVHIKRPFDVNFRGKFIGVRGKKDRTENGINRIKFFLDHEESFPKRRALSNGFFGMRGKKSSDDESTETSDEVN